MGDDLAWGDPGVEENSLHVIDWFDLSQGVSLMAYGSGSGLHHLHRSDGKVLMRNLVIHSWGSPMDHLGLSVCTYVWTNPDMYLHGTTVYMNHNKYPYLSYPKSLPFHKTHMDIEPLQVPGLFLCTLGSPTDHLGLLPYTHVWIILDTYHHGTTFYTSHNGYPYLFSSKSLLYDKTHIDVLQVLDLILCPMS